MANYAVEGLPTMDEERINEFYHFMLDSIEKLTENTKQGDFAVKLTGLISIDILTKLNKA